MNTHAGLSRYRELLGSEWNAFSDACVRSLPVDLRANTLRISSDALKVRLYNQGISAEPFPWDPRTMRATAGVGRTLEHWLGLLYVQEVVQSIPVGVLDPAPGERVLDLCAAPGGKATDIAARMENRGCLVANEPNGRRQQALLANINRIGVLNATLTEFRGQDFPTSDRFDRVLVDAPCSAEGTVRKDRSVRDGVSLSAIERLSRLQQLLITRGFDLLRPGGFLVYSTCTFAPEENEAVVAHLLAHRDAEILPLELPFPHARGITSWEGKRFPDAVTACARLYPHHLDSGGGFIASIRRSR